MAEHNSRMLSSWKEIAAYLGKSVRTVQRWESDLELPLRRPVAHNRRIVAALPFELDLWIRRQMGNNRAALGSPAQVRAETRATRRKLIALRTEMGEQCRAIRGKLEALRASIERQKP